MYTEIITDDSIGGYMGLLTNEEYFGIEKEIFTGFGAREEGTDQVLGILIAEVHMTHIRIRRLYRDPDLADEAAMTELLRVVTDLPEDQKLPVLFSGTDEEIDAKLLTEHGFKEIPGKYTVIEGTLEHFREFSAAKTCDVCTLDQLPVSLVERFILENEPDRFLQMPEDYLDTDRFSEASLVCVDGKKITGVILMEESDLGIRIPYMKSGDKKALLYALYVLRKLLFSEFGPGIKISFLTNDEAEKKAIHALFSICEEKKIHIFSYK